MNLFRLEDKVQAAEQFLSFLWKHVEGQKARAATSVLAPGEPWTGTGVDF